MNRDQIVKDWQDKKKAHELSQAKLRAKDKLSELKPEEKKAIAVLKSLMDDVGPTTVGQMYQLLNVIEAE